MRRVFISLFLITSILAAFSARAGEEDLPGSEKSQWGLRVGLGADPDQIVGGAQFLETPIAKNLFLVPNAEIGVGDDHLIFAAAAPFHYRFRTKAKVRPYAGGGVTVAFDHKTAGKNDDTDLEITLQATGGVIFRLKGGQEMFGELNLYFGDLWDLQAMVGWRF
jgi:hypothetical protein